MSNSLNSLLLESWSACLCLADSAGASRPVSPVIATAYHQGFVIGLIVVAGIGWFVWMFLQRQKLLAGRGTKATSLPAAQGPSIAIFDQLGKAHGIGHSDADLLQNAAQAAGADSTADVFVRPEMLRLFADAHPDVRADCERLIEQLFGSLTPGDPAGAGRSNSAASESASVSESSPMPTPSAGDDSGSSDVEQLAGAVAEM